MRSDDGDAGTGKGQEGQNSNLRKILPIPYYDHRHLKAEKAASIEWSQKRLVESRQSFSVPWSAPGTFRSTAQKWQVSMSLDRLASVILEQKIFLGLLRSLSGRRTAKMSTKDVRVPSFSKEEEGGAKGWCQWELDRLSLVGAMQRWVPIAFMILVRV